MIRAEAVTGLPEPPETHPVGRVCAEAGCGTRLSRYNAADLCSRHGGWPAKRHFVGRGSTHDDLADLMAEEPGA